LAHRLVKVLAKVSAIGGTAIASSQATVELLLLQSAAPTGKYQNQSGQDHQDQYGCQHHSADDDHRKRLLNLRTYSSR
jgi:hypothetical protein